MSSKQSFVGHAMQPSVRAFSPRHSLAHTFRSNEPQGAGEFILNFSGSVESSIVELLPKATRAPCCWCRFELCQSCRSANKYRASGL